MRRDDLDEVVVSDDGFGEAHLGEEAGHGCVKFRLVYGSGAEKAAISG